MQYTYHPGFQPPLLPEGGEFSYYLTFGTHSSVIYPDFQRLILAITFFRLAVFFHISSSCRIRSSVTLLLLTDSSSEYISSSFFSSLTGCSGSSAISDVSSELQFPVVQRADVYHLLLYQVGKSFQRSPSGTLV